MEEAQFKWLPKFTAACAKAPEEQRGKLLWALAQYGTYGIEPELEWPLDAHLRQRPRGHRLLETVYRGRQNGWTR